MKKRFVDYLLKAIPIFFLIVICSTAIVITLNSTVNRHKEAVFEQYVAKYKYILDGYSKAINYYLDNYQANLKLLCNQDFLLSNPDDESLIKYLNSFDNIKHNDFSRLFYSNADSKIRFSDGQILNFPVNTSAHTEFMSNLPFFISPYIPISENGRQIFLVYILLYKNNVISGVFGATVELNSLKKVLSNLDLHDGSKISLIDQSGQFLFHHNPDFIGKVFSPDKAEYIQYNSKYIAALNNDDIINNHIETIDTDENEIDLFYNKIQQCNWTILISVPAERKQDLYTRFSRMNLMLIVLSVVGILMIVTQLGFHLYGIFANRLKSISIDPLTNLWTRTHFEQEAEKLLRKYPRSKFMLIEGDIRGFKFINQNFGGENADKTIIFFANVLKESTKDLDAIMARGFADHFYFFARISSVHKAMAEFKKQNETINELIKNFDISFFPKFGIAFLMKRDDENKVTIQELIGQASFAKSTIKDNMLIQHAIYNSRLLKTVNKERYIESNMEIALNTNQFFVMYQPKIELLTDKIVGAEALVRWNSPNLGVVYPDEFIPLFEKNGFIKKLDFYVYEKVFAFIQRQLDENKPIVPISVNMSRSHSKPDKFMHDFLAIFHKFNIPPRFVEVEILERSFMNGNTLKEFTELLHAEGFTVAMDDFGSGESSLNMLTQIPVDVLKFDRTFLYSATQNGTIDPTSANFIETLIELGKNLKKQTIFEGVETQEQIDFLRSVDCDQVQGYFFSKPLTENDFIDYLNK